MYNSTRLALAATLLLSLSSVMVISAGGAAPQRFLIYSYRHSGTHFLRNAMLSARDVCIGDEVFMKMPPEPMVQELNLTKSLWSPQRSSKTDLARRFPELIEPLLDFYWGVLPDSANASSRLDFRTAHYVCDARYRFDPANPCGANATDAKGAATWDVTWGQLRDNLLRKRAVGALWNHNTGVKSETPAGIFANAPFLRHLKKLGVRVVLYERSNGLAESISQGNTMRADNSNGTQQLRKVHLQLQKLSKFNYQWAQRDSNYRSAFGALQREGVSAVYVTYERLMEQPDDLTRLYRFIGAEPPAAVATDPKLFGGKWHTAPTIEYVSNADEVRGWIRDGQLPGWSECMLDNDCASIPPEYTEERRD